MTSCVRMAGWLTFTVLVVPPVALAGVTVVDLSSPAPVPQAALDAAADGDILLLKPGAADAGSTLTLSGKGLTLVADGGTVELGRFIASAVPAGHQVTLRGLTFAPLSAAKPYDRRGSLEVQDCAGSVWIEDCSMLSPPQPSRGGFGIPASAMAGLLVEDSAAVLVVRGIAEGGRGSDEIGSCTPIGYGYPQAGGAGVCAVRSTVTLHGCQVRGGEGGVDDGNLFCPAGFNGKPGGSGVFVESSVVHVAGSYVQGGDKLSLSLSAGEGLRVFDAASSVTLRDTFAVAGAGSPPVVADIVAPSGTVTTLPAVSRAVEVSSPVREGQPAQLVISGQAGDFTALFIAFHGGMLVAPGKQGVWALGSPFFGPQLVAVNPVGEWTIPFTAGNLTPAALQGQSFLLQLVVHDGSQVLFEGNTVYTLIDSSIP